MNPSERSPYSAIIDRPPLKPPKGGKVIVWTIVNLGVGYFASYAVHGHASSVWSEDVARRHELGLA
jgi:hypothetical protein